MQKQELLAYQKHLNKVRLLVDYQEADGSSIICEIKKLNDLANGIAAEMEIINIEGGKEDSDKYIKFVKDTIELQIKVNGVLFNSTSKYQWLATRFLASNKLASAIKLYKSIGEKQNPTAMDILAYFQITLFENFYIFSTSEFNISNKQTSHKKENRRTVLTKAHKANGGFLEKEQLTKIAKDHGFAFAGLRNFYYKIWRDIK